MNFPQALDFLAVLKENNNKPWFDENRALYEDVKKDLLKLVQELIVSVSVFDPEIGYLEAKNCIFRINRDVRFAKDKVPYKTNISAYLSKGGKKSPFGGYYIHIDSMGSFLAGGMWMPEAPHLHIIRKEIDYHFDEFKAILEKPSFQKTFGNLENEKLSQVPKGFEKDNPAAEYLKYKSFVVIRKLEKEDLLKKDFQNTISNTFKEMKPFIDFLNKSISS